MSPRMNPRQYVELVKQILKIRKNADLAEAIGSGEFGLDNMDFMGLSDSVAIRIARILGVPEAEVVFDFRMHYSMNDDDLFQFWKRQREAL